MMVLAQPSLMLLVDHIDHRQCFQGCRCSISQFLRAALRDLHPKNRNSLYPVGTALLPISDASHDPIYYGEVAKPVDKKFWQPNYIGQLVCHFFPLLRVWGISKHTLALLDISLFKNSSLRRVVFGNGTNERMTGSGIPKPFTEAGEAA